MSSRAVDDFLFCFSVGGFCLLVFGRDCDDGSVVEKERKSEEQENEVFSIFVRWLLAERVCCCAQLVQQSQLML